MKEKNKKNHFRVHLLRKSIVRQEEKYKQELRNLEDSEVNQKRKESLIRILTTYDKELKKINKAQRNSYIGESEDNVRAYVKMALKKKGKEEGTLFKDMITIKHLRREFKSKKLGNPKFIVSRAEKQDKNKLKNILKGILGLDKEKEGIKEVKDKIRTVTRIISNRAIERYKGFYLDSQLANIKEGSKIKYRGYSKIEDEYRVGKKEADRIGKPTLETIKRFKEEVEGARKRGEYKEKKEEYERRAEIIEECESARIINRVAERYAEEVGIETWIWGPSGSKNPREEHAELYGKISKIGESPAEGGEYPGEIANCNCEMIFINERDLKNV